MVVLGWQTSNGRSQNNHGTPAGKLRIAQAVLDNAECVGHPAQSLTGNTFARYRTPPSLLADVPGDKNS